MNNEFDLIHFMFFLYQFCETFLQLYDKNKTNKILKYEIKKKSYQHKDFPNGPPLQY